MGVHECLNLPYVFDQLVPVCCSYAQFMQFRKIELRGFAPNGSKLIRVRNKLVKLLDLIIKLFQSLVLSRVLWNFSFSRVFPKRNTKNYFHLAPIRYFRRLSEFTGFIQNFKILSTEARLAKLANLLIIFIPRPVLPVRFSFSASSPLVFSSRFSENRLEATGEIRGVRLFRGCRVFS